MPAGGHPILSQMRQAIVERGRVLLEQLQEGVASEPINAEDFSARLKREEPSHLAMAHLGASEGADGLDLREPLSACLPRFSSFGAANHGWDGRRATPR